MAQKHLKKDADKVKEAKGTASYSAKEAKYEKHAADLANMKQNVAIEDDSHEKREAHYKLKFTAEKAK